MLRAGHLLTLTGIGGCGKTRLALELARQALPDSSWLIRLDGISVRGLVAQTVASTLDLGPGSTGSYVDTLVEHLRSREVVLVFDSCEHHVEECAELAESLLTACPGLAVLATSRQSLGVAGEQVWRVEPLTVPAGSRRATTTDVMTSEAGRLFVDRAGSRTATFALTAHNAAAVAGVCRKLEGIPLAVELAAAMTPVLSVPEILERLSDRFELLRAGQHSAPERQRTLEAALDWSSPLLSNAERRMMRRLSIFPQSFTLEAALAATTSGRAAGAGLQDLLPALMDKSLIVADFQSGGATRYRLLDTVREYWNRRLSKRERELAERNHLAYFLDLAEDADARHLQAQAACLKAVDVELDNFRAALQRAAINSSEAYGRLAGALSWFWFARCHFLEGGAHLEASLERPDVSDRTRARMLLGAAGLAIGRGEQELARRQLEEGIDIWRALGESAKVAEALERLGLLELGRDNPGAARRCYEEILAIWRTLGDANQTCGAMLWLGHAIWSEGDWVKAHRIYSEAHEMAVARQDEPHIMDAHHGLGDVALSRRDFKQADAHFTQALHRAAEFRDPMRCIFQLEGLAMASSGRAQPRRAIVLAAAAASARKTIGSNYLPPSWVEALTAALAAASQALGSPATAKARTEGAQLELDEAIPYALRKLELEGALGAYRQVTSILTRREARIAELVSNGMTSGQIAKRLGISARTVDAHAEHIRGKLGAHTRAQIAAWVARQALSRSEDEGSVAHSQF